jgi:hypothetical protein
MKLTVIRQDAIAIVDGVAASIDTSDLPAFIRVIQWDGRAGWVELAADAAGVQAGNQPLAALGEYERFVDRWQLARAESEAGEIKRKISMAEQKDEQRRAAEQHAAEQAAALAAFSQRQKQIEDERAAAADRLAALEQANADLAARLARIEAGDAA